MNISNNRFFKISLAAITGLLLAASFPNFIQKGLNVYTSFFILFAYIPLLLVIINEEKTKNVFRYSLLAGWIVYLADAYWLVNIEPFGAFAYPAWIILSLLMALFIAEAFALSHKLYKKLDIPFLFSLPVLYTLLEFVREWILTGNTILTPAQSLFNFPIVLQVLKYTGTYGLTFLIIAFNTLAAHFIVYKSMDLKRKEIMTGILLMVLIVILIIAGNIQYKTGERQVQVAVLQPNVYGDNENFGSRSFFDSTMSVFKKQVFSLKDQKPLLYVWPESGYPHILKRNPDSIEEISGWTTDNGSYHIIQSDNPIYLSGKLDKVYNTAFLVSPDNGITGEYSKIHLVPFGEYIPFGELLTFLPTLVGRFDFTGTSPGSSTEPLRIADTSLGALICYDGMFPEISRAFIKKGASFLVQLSYERWYGDSPASAQIFTSTLLRAVENNVYLVRCVESGISGTITNRGEIIKSTGLFTQEAYAYSIYLKDDKDLTFYTIFGDVYIYFLMVVLLVIIGKNLLIRKKNFKK